MVLAELQRIENRLPAIVQAESRKTRWRFIDFFTFSIRNSNTREAYQGAILQFLSWCEGVGVAGLHQIKPIVISAYLEQMEIYASKPIIKQHRSAISKMFDWPVAGNVGLDVNPASAVKAPKPIVRQGKTPVLSAEETRQLLDSIDRSAAVGFRDRALLGVSLQLRTGRCGGGHGLGGLLPKRQTWHVPAA